MDWIKALKPGNKVIVHGKYEDKVATVQKKYQGHVVVCKTKFRISDGRKVKGREAKEIYISEWSVEEENIIREKWEDALYKLRGLDPKLKKVPLIDLPDALRTLKGE